MIRELNLDVALHVMLTSLKQGSFADSLARKPPLDIDEFRRRAIGYIAKEEVASSRQEVHAQKEGQMFTLFVARCTLNYPWKLVMAMRKLPWHVSLEQISTYFCVIIITTYLTLFIAKCFYY